MITATDTANTDARIIEMLDIPDLPDEYFVERPFDDEHEYWKMVSAHTICRFFRDDLKIKKIDCPLFMNGILLSHSHSLRCLEADLDARIARLEDIMFRRKALTGSKMPAPRVLRLAAAMKLLDRELEVLNTMIVVDSNLAIGHDSAIHVELQRAEAFFADSSQKWPSFADRTSPLVVEKVIILDGDSDKIPVYGSGNTDQMVLRALLGYPMSEDQILRVDSDTLRQILNDERSATPTKLDSDDNRELITSPATSGEEVNEVTEPACEPFKNDTEYIKEHLDWISERIEFRKANRELDDDSCHSYSVATRQKMSERSRRQADYLARRLKARIKATRESGAKMPRCETLAEKYGLSEFAKHILIYMLGYNADPTFEADLHYYDVTVGRMCILFFESMEDQLAARREFYRSAPLIRHTLLLLQTQRSSANLLDQEVTMDARLVEYLTGLDGEGDELAEGTHLYKPHVALSRVVMAESDKELVLRTVMNYPKFIKARKKSGLDDLLGYGRGVTFLFHGPSGTGKTMLANAMASQLGKKILLINYSNLEEDRGAFLLNHFIREAVMQDAILFFDECEVIFESRDKQKNPGLTVLLTALEHHDGLVIMATNRPFDLDESMHRRITMVVEFRIPGPAEREQIWREHIPRRMKLSGPIDYTELAYDFELTGGYIKNAVVTALASATARQPNRPAVTMTDLREAAVHQARSRLKISRLEDAHIPRCGVDSLVLDKNAERIIKEIIGLNKARRTLIQQWGFTEEAERGMGITALFHGPPGTGKSRAAEAVAYELGRPLRRVNMAQMVSMWVGEGAKNIEAIFQTSGAQETVLVFDEADALFAERTVVRNSMDRHANHETAILLRELERYPGVVILTSNLPDQIDRAFMRRLKHVVAFTMPDEPARMKLWQLHIPDELPVASDIDLHALAAAFRLSGAEIRGAIIKAAARVALRPQDKRRVTQSDFEEAAREAAGPEKALLGFRVA